MLMFVMFILYVFFLLQSIAFFTLLERHVLGITQHRFGPKNNSWFGLLQPIIDGVNLCKKEQIIIFNCSPSIFIGSTIISFSLFYIEFLCLPYPFNFITNCWSYLLVIVLVSVNVYFLLVAGVYSKSKYSYLGSIRTVVASVSYEVIFSINMLTFMLYHKGYTLEGVNNLGVLVFFPVFFISTLVEISRTPFDYSESESELVSGINTEYSSVGFVLLFLNEYGSLLFFSVIVSDIFAGGYFIAAVMVFFVLILVRSSMPRLRYDKLIGVMWLQLFFHVALGLFSTYYVLII